MKKVVIAGIIIIGGVASFFGIYSLLENLYENSLLENLENYEWNKEEKVLKKFSYNQKDYFITAYYDDSSSWSNLHILGKEKKKYYMLQDIKKCDSPSTGENIAITKNQIYMHCIGKSGEIDKYTIDNYDVQKEIFRFNYEQTPEISQIHLIIDKVSKKYIELSTSFDKKKVRCFFKTKKCQYIEEETKKKNK